MKIIAIVCLSIMAYLSPNVTSPNIYQFTMTSIEGKPVSLKNMKAR